MLDIDHTLSRDLYSPRAGKFGHRPGLIPFLAEMACLFELVLWTASTPSHALVFASQVDPMRRWFGSRLLAGNTTIELNHHHHYCPPRRTLSDEPSGETMTNCVKFLPLLDRPLHNVVLLDDRPDHTLHTGRNGLSIPPFLNSQRRQLRTALLVGPCQQEQERDPKEATSDDDELTRVVPILRAVAAARHSAVEELDYWRPFGYGDRRERRFGRTSRSHVDTGAQLSTPPIPAGTYVTRRRSAPEAYTLGRAPFGDGVEGKSLAELMWQAACHDSDYIRNFAVRFAESTLTERGGDGELPHQLHLHPHDLHPHHLRCLQAQAEMEHLAENCLWPERDPGWNCRPLERLLLGQ